MDWLKAQLDRVQRQLAGLTATQKMLTASLVAIMVITIIWWGKYAGEAEMVPLLNQTFSATEIGKVQRRLDQKGILYTVTSDRILVPADHRMEILTDLAYAGAMPHDTSSGFDEMIKQSSPFDSESKQEAMRNRAKEMMLSRIVGAFPGVAEAEVLIDPNSKQRLEKSTEPSATVNIRMQEGVSSNQRLVDAAADAVAGAQAGLSISNIKVVVDGHACRVHDSGSDPLADGSYQLQLRQQNAAFHENQVREAFSFIPHLLVSVTVQLNTTTSHSEKHEYDAKGALQKEQKTSTEKDLTNMPAQVGGEAGAQPNTGVSVQGNAAGGGGSTQEHSKDETTFQNFVPETRVTTSTPAGDAKPISATIRVPMSYFIGEFKARDRSVKEPTYQQLQPIMKEKVEEMKEGVAKCVGLPSVNDVSIAAYVDPVPPMSAAVASAIPTPTSISYLLGGHAKEIALGALAVMSLFMASMMVRKGAPVSVPVAAKPATPPGPPTVLEAGEPLAGEASPGNPLLDGMELNEDAVRAQQMVDQVSTLVKENPDAAANLVKRWLNRS